MPRGATDSFSDFLYRIMQEIGKAELAPDTDHEFLSSLREMVIGRYKSSDSTTNVAGELAATGTEGMPMGGGAPIPVQSVEPLSRGPAPTPDMSGATEELSRIMAGS